MVTHVVAYLLRNVLATASMLAQCKRPYARVAQEDVRTLPTRSTSPRRPHQSPPEAPLGLNGRPDRGPGCGTR